MGNPVEIDIVAQQFIKIGHAEQNLPIGHTGAVRRGRAHAVHAFRVFGALMKMIHPRAVFLAKRNLPLIAQLRGNIVAQSLIVCRFRKTHLRFGMGLCGEIPYFRGIRFFQIAVNVLHKGLSEQKTLL